MNSRPIDTPAPARASRRPFRLWMSGSLAVVLAALVTARGLPDDDEPRSSVPHRALRHSPYGVAETVMRIEAVARERGQAVLFRVGGAAPVIVFGSSVGGTPVVMDHADSRPDVPLAVQVRAAADGGAEVLIADAPLDYAGAIGELPDAVAEEIAALPALVDRALS